MVFKGSNQITTYSEDGEHCNEKLFARMKNKCQAMEHKHSTNIY
jgi:hypothetical protein